MYNHAPHPTNGAKQDETRERRNHKLRRDSIHKYHDHKTKTRRRKFYSSWGFEVRLDEIWISPTSRDWTLSDCELELDDDDIDDENANND